MLTASQLRQRRYLARRAWNNAVAAAGLFLTLRLRRAVIGIASESARKRHGRQWMARGGMCGNRACHCFSHQLAQAGLLKWNEREVNLWLQQRESAARRAYAEVKASMPPYQRKLRIYDTDAGRWRPRRPEDVVPLDAAGVRDYDPRLSAADNWKKEKRKR